MPEVFKFSQCPLCRSKTPSKDSLLKHIVIHHRDDKCRVAFSCFVCHEMLDSYNSLKTHRSTSHGTIHREIFYAEEDDEVQLFYEQLFMEADLRCNLEDTLQFKAAEVLYDLRDNGNTTQYVMDSVIEGSDALFDMFLDIVQSKFCQISRKSNSRSLTFEEISKCLDGFRGNSFFEGLQNQKLFAKYLKDKKWLVPPHQVVLLYDEIIRKNGKIEKFPVDFGYVVSFLPLLEKILNLPEVIFCIDNPKPTKEGTIASPLDGSYYRNHPVVKKFPSSTLAFGTYVDDARLNDTASTKPLNGRFFYWQLFNVYPELRSSTRAINLLFCAQTEIVKKYGYKKFLDDYIEGIKKLSSDEGVTFDIKGKKRTFHGIHLLSSGDNPASANLAGFKESHFADLLCRQCMGTKPAIYQSFSETDFNLRTKELHEEYVKELEEYNNAPFAWRKGKENPSVAYGVNSRSLFMDICDVTKCFPQDLMHDVILGTLKLEILCLLNHAVTETKSISLDTINSRIQKYALYFGVNRPSAIEASHLANQNLRHSAAETLALAHMLPFALLKDENLSTVESVCDAEKLKCFILRLNLLGLQMATEFTLQDIKKLKKLTRTHHKLFRKCYPGVEIPKGHFEIHFASQILLFGPLRQHWCFRFEGKHAYFKRLAKILHNTINIYSSISKRHQIRQGAEMMFSVEGRLGPYLSHSNFCGVPQIKKISQIHLEHRQLLVDTFPALPPNTLYFKKFEYVTVNCVHYAAKDAFVLDFVSGVPVLGEIIKIYGHKDSIVFIYSKLQTLNYEPSLNAFRVKNTGELGAASTSQIVHHQKVPFVRTLNSHFVVVTCNSFLATLM